MDGSELGEASGAVDVLGSREGRPVGTCDTEGLEDGLLEGDELGCTDGNALGTSLGLSEGDELGCTDGNALGLSVGERLGCRRIIWTSR